MKLSAKRQSAIYEAVYNKVLDARMEIAKQLQGHPEGEEIDYLLFTCSCDAAFAAVEAAKGESKR